MYEISSFSLTSFFFNFSILTVLMDSEVVLIMGLTCILLMVAGVEHLFLCLLSTHASFLEYVYLNPLLIMLFIFSFLTEQEIIFKEYRYYGCSAPLPVYLLGYVYVIGYMLEKAPYPLEDIHSVPYLLPLGSTP